MSEDKDKERGLIIKRSGESHVESRVERVPREDQRFPPYAEPSLGEYMEYDFFLLLDIDLYEYSDEQEKGRLCCSFEDLVVGSLTALLLVTLALYTAAWLLILFSPY